MERSSGTLAVPGTSHSGLVPGAASGQVPSRAHGVELFDRLAGSGYRDAPYLVRRGDGQTFQLTSILYYVLEAVDGRRDEDEIAAVVSTRIGRDATGDDVRFLIESKLRPLGVLRTPDGTEPVVRRMNPLLAIRGRIVVTRPELTRRITAPFAVLFLPPVVVAVLVTFLLSATWLFIDKGLASAAHHVLYEPELLLLVFGLMLASAAFHEIGHAAACRYGGATPGAMGIGLYLLWPVFYTDVTDSYRLSRGGRLRVDLGGLYFNAVFAVATFAVWSVTDVDALLVVVPLQLVQMLHQLLPLVRLDGYHILADLTGVPDLFARIKPTLLTFAPRRHRPVTVGALKPWVSTVVTAWVVVVVPLLALMLFGIVMSLPRVAATAWDSIGLQWDTLRLRWAEGDAAGMSAQFLSIAAMALPVFSMSYLVSRVVQRTSRRVWRATNGRPLMRTLAAFVAVSMVGYLVWSWWPKGQYEPIQSDERGTLFSGFDPHGEVLPEDVSPTSTRRGLPPASEGPAAGPMRGSAPGPGTDSWPTAIPATRGTPPTTPLPPPTPGQLPRLLPDLLRGLIPLPSVVGEGDNQALALNTQDRTAIVALAFAMEWVADGVIDNFNEAYALASCVECLTMAIAYQAVFIVGPVEEVVPRNNAVAVNVDCIECLTYALAAQTVISLPAPPDDATVRELSFVWEKLDQLAARIEQLSPTEIDFPAEFQAIEREIIGVLARAGLIAVARDGSLIMVTPPPGSPPLSAPPTTEPTTSTDPAPTTSTDPAPMTTEPAPTTSTDPAPTTTEPAPTDTAAPTETTEPVPTSS